METCCVATRYGAGKSLPVIILYGTVYACTMPSTISASTLGIGPSPLNPFSASHLLKISLSKVSGVFPSLNLSSYVSASQKREESGVCASSINIRLPSLSYQCQIHTLYQQGLNLYLNSEL